MGKKRTTTEPVAADKEKKNAQINVYVTATDFAAFESAMLSDGDDTLSTWVAKVIRLYIRGKDEDRDMLARIDRNVSQLKERLGG